MPQRLRVPAEPCFVRAFALAIDLGDTLGLLMEIGALGSPDPSASLWTGLVKVPRTETCPERSRRVLRVLGH